MARTKDDPDYSVKFSARLGRMVRWGQFVVPETVNVSFTGGGDIEGRKWPDIMLTFTIRNDAAVCNEFRIVSKPGDRSIRTSDLKFLDVDQLAQMAFMSHIGEQVGDNAFSMSLSDSNVTPGMRTVRERVNNSYKQPEEELIQVARIFLNPKHRKSPTLTVQTMMGYSRPTADRRIAAARRRGLIPPVRTTDEEMTYMFNALTTELDEDN